MNIDVDIKDNSEEILKEFQEKVELGLQTIAFTAEGYAKEECPVDTGRLRNSISNAVEGTDAYIGTNVEYAPSVEFRDIEHQTGNAHFLRNAVADHDAEYQEIMESALKS